MSGQIEMFGPNDRKGASFSPCRTWRYRLWRVWGDGPLWAVIGLNPSTADEEIDDHTIRRCRKIAKAHGAGGLLMLNLYAYRSTDPRALNEVDDPVGFGNDAEIRKAVRECERVIAAWGCFPKHADRMRKVKMIVEMEGGQLEVWGLTKDGFPRHPSRLPGIPTPVPWIEGLDVQD